MSPELERQANSAEWSRREFAMKKQALLTSPSFLPLNAHRMASQQLVSLRRHVV